MKRNTFNLTETLLLMFVIAKITKIIDWSWWWVLSPLWISLALYIVMILIGWKLSKKERK